MDEVNRLQCRLAIEALEGLRADKTIDDDIYHKGVVAIAFEYADAEEMDIALGMLVKVPKAYYADVQLGQMCADPLYSEVVVRLARLLVLAGYSNPDILPPGAARA